MVQVYFIDGQPVPVDLTGVSSLDEMRWRIAHVLGAPSPDNVELLDEDGNRLDEKIKFIDNLGDMRIQTFVFGLDPPQMFREDSGTSGPWPSPPISEGMPDEEAQKLYEQYMEHENTTQASSEPADSPSNLYPIHEAVMIGDCEAVNQLLSEGNSVDKRDGEGDTALHRAAYQSRKDLVDILLGARADPNAVDRKGKTPLRKAYDNKDVAQALLSANADPNIADKNGNTALHRSAEDGFSEVATVLLAANADPNLLSDEDLSALHTASIFGKENVLKVLIEAGANIHSKGCGGNTALHFAAYGEREEVGKVLLGLGADVTALNEDGETPLEHALTAPGCQRAPEWLQEHMDLGPRID
jgi:ankyrin repeat protein